MKPADTAATKPTALRGTLWPVYSGYGTKPLASMGYQDFGLHGLFGLRTQDKGFKALIQHLATKRQEYYSNLQHHLLHLADMTIPCKYVLDDFGAERVLAEVDAHEMFVLISRHNMGVSQN